MRTRQFTNGEPTHATSEARRWIRHSASCEETRLHRRGGAFAGTGDRSQRRGLYPLGHVVPAALASEGPGVAGRSRRGVAPGFWGVCRRTSRPFLLELPRSQAAQPFLRGSRALSVASDELLGWERARAGHRHVRDRQLLPPARHRTGPRAFFHPRGGRDARRPSRGGAEPRLLVASVRRRSRGGGPDGEDQRRDLHRRGHRTAGVPRDRNYGQRRFLAADHDVSEGGSLCQVVRRPRRGDLPGHRPPENRRVASAGREGSDAPSNWRRPSASTTRDWARR